MPLEPSDDVVAAPQGFGERFSNSLSAILFGFLGVLIACWGLFVNEGRAVKTSRALMEGQGLVQAAVPSKFDPALNGRLVHVSGQVTSTAGVVDDAFGIPARGLVLARKVEMFQWVETETGSGQDRKFVYSKQWRDRPVDSSRFRAPAGHTNPAGLSWSSTQFVAPDAQIEGYKIGTAIDQLSGGQPFRLTQSMVDGIQARDRSRTYRLVDGTLYQGATPLDPQVGHHRISYTLVPEGAASFVGQQTPNGIDAYRASNGRSIKLVQSGLRSAEEMFASAQSSNSKLTWLFRGLGLLGMFFGFNMLFAPVQLLASYVPILGTLVNGATSLLAGAATAILGPLIIAVAWFSHRPLVSMVVLVLGIGAAYGFRSLRQQKLTMPKAGAPSLAR